jgi:hypothetical protein
MRTARVVRRDRHNALEGPAGLDQTPFLASERPAAKSGVDLGAEGASFVLHCS